MNIKVNPADELAKTIEKNWDEAFEHTNIKMLHRKSLDVNGKKVEQCVSNFHDMISRKKQQEPDARFFVLHIGNHLYQ